MNHMFGGSITKTGVYMIENIINGKCYVGSTSNSFKVRFKAHLYDLRNNKHHSSKLQRSWNKYGEQNFIFLRLEVCNSEEDLLSREQYYIDTKNPFFNECKIAGSCKGVKRTNEVRAAISKRMMGNTIGQGMVMSDEAKLKISIANKGRKPHTTGKHLSEETKLKISEANKGSKRSQETRDKMSELKKGKPTWNKGIKGSTPWNKGKAFSEETRLKMSLARKRYFEERNKTIA